MAGQACRAVMSRSWAISWRSTKSVEDSREDDVVHLPLVGKGRGNGIGGDMVIEGIAVQD
jgi:hypothetical protein